ncbi:Cdc6/Cdc18 family protein [Halorussus aquaticus]|uniref:ORC1-type DNA replication protein n=1 Tax=Halorussus aquaticus TaxID=2953748 RepID=A0ABD5QA77_9EURY|nr:orc1/cdc6 family replication initiation protein [Halorussus aquaticus]
MAGLFDEVTETLFANKTVLEEEYEPDTILEREDEIEEYKDALKDVLFGRNPSNVMLYGKAGVGKTAVTTYVLDELQQATREREQADTLYVHRHNCNDDTVFSAVRALVNQLLPEDEKQFPKKGLSTADAREELYAQLERVGGTHLVVLDEIDHLAEADDLLYELPRARANGHLDAARIGVIGISNNYTFRNQLSSKVKDTLREEEISFSTYDATELRTILYDRAEKALVDDGYTDGAVGKAAALAAQDTGSARQAIDLLRKGGEIAEREDAATIEDDHIDRAREEVKRGRLRDKIADQSLHARHVLEAVAHIEHNGDTPVRTKDVMKTYQRIADERGDDPLTTLKSIQNHLSDLQMLGFLIRHEVNKGQSGGYYYTHELDMEPDVVFEACNELDKEDAV